MNSEGPVSGDGGRADFQDVMKLEDMKIEEATNEFPPPPPVITPEEQKGQSELLHWLVVHEKEFLLTGSTALFGEGQDRDFILAREQIPEGLLRFLPDPKSWTEYGEGFQRVQDEESKTDYIVGPGSRVREFKFAAEKARFIATDCKELWELMRNNKLVRVGVFRALRNCHPETELASRNHEMLGDKL